MISTQTPTRRLSNVIYKDFPQEKFSLCEEEERSKTKPNENYKTINRCLSVHPISDLAGMLPKTQRS